MKENERLNAVDACVQRYLNAEASHVDGRAMLERARAIVRRRRTYRRAAWAGLAAAVAILAVTALLSTSSPSARPKLNRDPLVNLGHEGKRAVGGLAQICHTLNDSVDGRFRNVAKTLKPKIEPQIATATRAFARSFSDDASHLKRRLGSAFHNLLDKAGLTL